MSKKLEPTEDSLYTDERLRELFSEFDPRKEGMIDQITFKQLLNSMGLFPVSLKGVIVDYEPAENLGEASPLSLKV